MSHNLELVRQEIEDLHRFFVDWFAGKIDQDSLSRVFLVRIDPEMIYITPNGHRLKDDQLVDMLRAGYGVNPDFRIDVRDVTIQRETKDHFVITYTEWQKGARASARSENARMTTLLLTKEPPFRWLHIHETWLPEAEQAAGSFDFG